MHICVTHVDARTGVPCDVAPMRKGPAFPNVNGLAIQWFNQSEWPTDKPLFYGTCGDDADLTLEGIVSVLSEQEYTMLWDTEKVEVINQIRVKRNQLLSETDWIVTMHTEFGTDIPVQWKTYRQALRDITAQETFPQSVVWPTEPE